MRKVLVTGGAGYIGSHMVLKLLEAGYQPIVVDDLSTGLKLFVPPHVPLHIFDIGDTKQLRNLFSQHTFDMVMHFAASIKVGESIEHPAKYYHNNVVNTLALLNVMKEFNVRRLVFSSTAAIFGEPHYVPVDERHPKNPINAYGMSKLMCERILGDYDVAYGLKSVSLRYFNAAGADSRARTGYRTENASHLIPRVLQVALGERERLEVYGQDYNTPDGTCIRDYIHVEDLCGAHLFAMEHLLEGGNSRAYNLGNGRGYSVRDLLNIAEKMTGQSINVINVERRSGDPEKLLADISLINKELGWKPVFQKLDTIMLHAWQWQKLYTSKMNESTQ